ncbi:MAG: hypothetical protein ACRDLN_08065 [Solirubrobacteraceae bacterium]
MASAVAPAWIGFAGGIVAAIVSAVVAIRQSRLQAEVQERTALMEREQRAEEVLKRYREPLAAAAFDLQSRLYNILCLGFFDKFGGDHERCEIAENTTLFRLAQYLGWTEILRRDIQFLSFPEADDTRRVVELLWAVTRRLSSSVDDQAIMVWADEQRAIGERMIVEEHAKVLCMGFARFHDEYAERFAPWCERLRGELHAATGRDRLRDVQHLLCELVETLDAQRVRYTQDLERA